MRQRSILNRLRGWVKRLSLPLNALVITAIAFGLSYFVKYDLSSISAFAPMEKATDFDLTDVYNSVADRRAKRVLSDDIVIVSVDGCSRKEIADVIDYVDYMNPSAIGLDVFFSYPSEADSELIACLSQCRNIVLPVGIQRSGRQTSIFGSYFYDDFPVEHKGVVNLSVNSVRNVIRDFVPEYVIGEDTLRSFSAELARIAAPKKYEALMARGRGLEPINYPSWEFEIISAEELCGGQSLDDMKQYIEGKVVMIGNIFDHSDHHLTPVDEGMAGLMIHARILQTILDSCYIDRTPEDTSWTMAIVLSFVFILLVLKIKKDFPFDDLIVRILQLAVIYLFLVFGCKAFANNGRYLNFGPTLLMFGLGLLARDIWLGLIGLIVYVRNRKK